MTPRTTNKDRKNLGEIFRLKRESLHMTQGEVALKAGVTANYYAEVERGFGNVAFDYLVSICRVLKIEKIDIN